MKRFFTFTLSLLLPVLLFGQGKVFLNPGGSIAGPADEVLKIRTAIESHQGFSKITPYDNSLLGVTGTIDTLRNNGGWGVNFGFFGQDVMIQWFEAPADMIIKGMSFRSSDVTGPTVSVKLVDMNWTRADIEAISGGATYIGYYDAVGNGFNDIEPLIDNDHEFTVGDWVEAGGLTAGSPFGNDLWSDGGFGKDETVAAVGDRTWVPTNLLGFEPEVVAGTIFGVVVKNSSANLDLDRHGLFADNTIGVPGFKFYNNGRFSSNQVADPASWGWWLRLYTWDIEVAVDLIGDRAPKINSMSVLPTTLSTADRTVEANITDDNPSGGAAGVATANLMYTTDGGTTWNTVAMTGTEPDFTGTLPGQAPGTVVSYYVEATDVGALSSSVPAVSYNIFEQVMRTLLVMNGQSYPGFATYPADYYFGHPTPYPYDHDTWAYGPLTEELVNYYYDIIEITTAGPNDINSDVIRAWLEADPTRDYMLAGDEWLGAQSNWTDGPHAAGSFHFDILGINYEYNDIVTGSGARSQLITVPGSALGNTLDSLANNVQIEIDSVTTVTGVDTVWYDPNYEISVANWLDGVDVEADADVFLKAIDPSDGSEKNVGHSRVLSAGNKIAYFAYDPISVNSTPYYWFGWDQASPQVVALYWMEAAVGIEDSFNEFKPTQFALKQNFPNPFNPTTEFSYNLPTAEKVQVKVFDLMGREVTTLVNKQQNAGVHTVKFDATNFASGMYVYSIEAGSYRSSKRMLLIK